MTIHQAYTLCVERAVAIGDALDLPSYHVTTIEGVPRETAITIVGNPNEQPANVVLLSCGYLPRIEGKPKEIEGILLAMLRGIEAANLLAARRERSH